MSDKAISIALFTRLASLDASFETAYPNTKFDAPDPDSDTPWQRPSIIRAENETPFTGTQRALTKKMGILVVQLFYPLGNGIGDAMDKAVALQGHFSRGLTLTSGTTKVVIREKPSIQTALPEADAWYVLPVHIPFYSYDAD